MNILSGFRNRLFWTIDSLKGDGIKNHYNDIKFTLSTASASESQKLLSEKLTKLMGHSVETVNFYKQFSKQNLSLNDFPVINKDVVRENYEDFKSSIYINKKNTPVLTGGSTGTPFRLFHDSNKRKRHMADNIFYAENGGYHLGDRLYLIRAWHGNEKKAMQFLKKNVTPYAIVNYTDDDMEKLLMDLRNDPSEKCIVCFASMCEILVGYLDSQSKPALENLNIKSIVTDGDTLTQVTKNKMQHYFQTPTIARYGNMECGIMGQQPYTGGDFYELNWASYHFELLDVDSDEPAKPGQLGRIVVTDLFNYCMPLIRYDTGDLASFSDAYASLDEAKCFERIEGRKVDLVYDTKGRTLSPYMVIQKMTERVELKQFQFIQEGKKDYTFKLNPKTEFNKEMEIELINDTKTYLGEDANITIEYVDEIPLLNSGKRKQVMNAM